MSRHGEYWEKLPICGRRMLVAKTCAKCGELRQVFEFGLRPNGYYTAYCDICYKVFWSMIKHRNNDISRLGAINHRNYWTMKDLDELEHLLFNEHLSSSQIAKKMGRTNAAITNAKQKFIGTPPKESQ